MKIANLLLCLVVIHRIQFEQFKQAVDFDPAFIGILKKNNERFLPYITILKEGEIELQEDHSVLQQAKEKIIQTREFIESLDEGCIQIDSWNFNQIIDQTIDYNPQVQEVWKKEIGCQEEDTDVENPFDGDKVKYKKERKAHKNTHAFAQIKNGSKLSKFKSKISKLMLMATKMQDNQDKNGLKRKQRKIELCDEIIDELIDMILILEKVMNDYGNQNEIYELYNQSNNRFKKLQLICGQTVISYQDVGLIEEKNLKRRKKYSIKLTLKEEIQLVFANFY